MNQSSPKLYSFSAAAYRRYIKWHDICDLASGWRDNVANQYKVTSCELDVEHIVVSTVTDEKNSHYDQIFIGIDLRESLLMMKARPSELEPPGLGIS
jgi:hypothetical protein